MNILVTGGLGFIGSHLARELLKDPESNVHVVDNLTGTAYSAEEVVAAITAGRPGRLTYDITSVARFTCDREFDAIYHLASIVGPAAVLRCAGRITQSIVRDCYRMIDLAIDLQARLVFVSTSEVYGGGDEGFCSEDTPRVFRGIASARQEYAAAKMACEIAIANLCSSGKLDAVTIRPFNVAGVRQQGAGGFVVPRFVGQALLGLPLTVFGDGSQLRAFTDARDVATGIQLAWRKGDRGEIFNVGNPNNRVSIGQLAQCVREVTGSSAEIDFLDPKTVYGDSYADAADKFPDAEKLIGLGWRPSFDVDAIVRSVFDHFTQLELERVCRLAALQRAMSETLK